MALSETPPLSEQKIQPLFHYFGCAKSRFERLAVPILNGVTAFSELNPASASIAIYVFCTGMGCTMCIVMGFLDLVADTQNLKAVMGGLNRHIILPLEQFNWLLSLLFGFCTLLGMLSINVNHSRPRIRGYKIRKPSRRSKMIKGLPKTRYGRLRKMSDYDDGNRNDPSSCAICLGCIEQEDGVRILPNCKHYFHTPCIDRWLLLCPHQVFVSSLQSQRYWQMIFSNWKHKKHMTGSKSPAGVSFSAVLGD